LDSAYPDTYYQVTIQAHNAIGLSDEDTIIVKTARGMHAPSLNFDSHL
jgi:hypothetical protein